MRQQWADYRLFWQEFRRTFQTTGAVLPSGRELSKALARFVREGAGGRRILEVGPGTGAVTHAIVQSLQPGDRLELVERNEEFVARLRCRIDEDPAFRPLADRITLHHAGVEELTEDQPFDVIVSGLPLNNFPADVVQHILAKLVRLLAPGGTLSFFQYMAIRRFKGLVTRGGERERLHDVGAAIDQLLHNGEVRRDRVWLNVPPAWVHHVKASSALCQPSDT